MKFLEQLQLFRKKILKEGATKTEPSVLAYTSKKVETGEKSDNVRFSPRQLQTIYFTNQFCFRAVNIRNNELITRG